MAKKEIWSEMKVRLRWNIDDQYWMNPDNLLLVLRKACPNTEFQCQYLIHPSKDVKENTYAKILKRYRKSDRKINRKIKKRRKNNG